MIGSPLPDVVLGDSPDGLTVTHVGTVGLDIRLVGTG